MGLEFLLNLFNSLPGLVVYNLLVFLGLLAAAGIVLTEWRRTRNEDLGSYIVALGGTMALHLVLVFLTPVHFDPSSWWSVFSGPLLYSGELLSLLLLMWAFGHDYWKTAGRPLLGWLVGGWSALLVLFSILWITQNGDGSLNYTEASWQAPVWFVLSALAAGAGAVILRLTNTENKMAFAAFIVLGVGSVLECLGMPALGPVLPFGEGLGRFLFMLGYPLFAVAFYNAVLVDLDTYRQELQGLSREALRQSQELLFLIEATRSIGEGFDVRGVMTQVTDNIAMALRAHTVLILLNDKERPGVLTVASSYQVLGWKAQIPRELRVKDYPALAKVLGNREQLILGPNDDLSPAEALFALADLPGGGPLLVQPLLRKNQLRGLLVVCNDNSKPPFTYEQGLLATTIGVQIATAVENIELYGAVQAKAMELSQLLTVREAELVREEAILESMAEGILVLDAQGYYTLMNHAAEKILGAERSEVLGRGFSELISTIELGVGFDVETIVALEEPYEATFNLDERRIRVHAAPVLTESEHRLGVVAVLQDITREYLAEESKREFIASISHELRTPLTAIKGYTEVMLSGMAGELPPAFGQFLGVIRENTTRMASLTNNIISVAEIERGRVGLSYQMIEVPDLVNELLGRYQDRIEERMLTVKLDFTEDLPSIEADPNRMRLILDNLLSNAVKFTYPSGRITIGCRGIQGTLGKPTFFSIWVSDTGVGIPIEDQNRIWERFYRVENSLSLEAGGLGIGLTIAKALVEAHGGRVWVDSVLNEGSTFTVLLPIYRSQGVVTDMEMGVFW
ncbi:MAG: PAS domain-containing protein [Anaerolineae bacterium]|nr:PAS domain-containing protein [Anaerolineae bacterium]